MTLPRAVLTFALALLAALTVAAGAHAADPIVADIEDKAGDSGPGADVTRLQLDFTAPTLRVTVTYAAPPAVAPPLDLVISAVSRNQLDPGEETCDPDVLASMRLQPDPAGARLRLTDGQGGIVAAPQVSGATVTYTFTSPSFAQTYEPGFSSFEGVDLRDPFACVSGTIADDAVFGTFEGKEVKLTTRVAQSALVVALSQRFKLSPERVVDATTGVCPKRSITDLVEESDEVPAQPPTAPCRFHLRHGKHLRTGIAFITLRGGYLAANPLSYFLLPKAYRFCGTKALGTSDTWRDSFPAAGSATVEVWGAKVPCATARKVARRGVARPRIAGFACVRERGTRGQEGFALECSRPGGRKVYFRVAF